MAGVSQLGPQNVTEGTREFLFCAGVSPDTGLTPAGVPPVSTRLELAMRPMPILVGPVAAAVLLVFANAVMAANPTRIAETGAYLLGNAYRCGVADDRVVRAGKVIRQLIAAAADDASERSAAKSRFAEIFRENARAEGNGHTPIPPCRTVVMQFERLEQFRDRTSHR